MNTRNEVMIYDLDKEEREKIQQLERNFLLKKNNDLLIEIRDTIQGMDSLIVGAALNGKLG